MAGTHSTASAPREGSAPEAESEKAASSSAKGVTLAVTGPLHTDSFTIPAEGESEAVSFNRAGTRVLKSEVDNFVQRAALSGVALSVLPDPEED